jgi:hypothetical protein
MVSQLTMPRILGFFACLTAIFLFVPACGQNEGGRCQIDSDCGSGLVCRENTNGNGRCRSTATDTDAAQVDVHDGVKADALVTPDVIKIDSTEIDSTALDAAAVLDAGAVLDAAAALDAGAAIDAAAAIDASAEDSGSFDSISLD